MRFFLVLALLAPMSGPGPRKHVVEQKDKTFLTTELHISKGDSVVFTNKDAVMHNVFSTTAGFKFNLESQAPNTSKAIPFTQSGTAMVRCAFHPRMKLTVVVE